MTKVINHGRALESERWICSLFLDRIEDLPSTLHLPTKHFCLLVIVNAQQVTDELLSQAAESLVRQGAAYVCTWGPNCEHVHAIFDEVCEALLPTATERDVIMTTWHDRDTLNEAIWFATTTTQPASKYSETCQTVLCVTVDDRKLAKQVEEIIGTFLPEAQRT